MCARFKMALPDQVEGIFGGIIIPAGIPEPTLSRRPLEKMYPHLAIRLLDPQLYLATLNGATCRRTCTNLASYEWFNVPDARKFSSSSESQSEWRKRMKARMHDMWPNSVAKKPKEIERAIRSTV